MKALVLSGGGAKGAFQIGALRHILGDLQKQYDIITGISVGALNAAYLSMFAKGAELEAISGLWGIWNQIDDSHIYQTRYPILGSYFSLLFSSLSSRSLYDSKPLADLVHTNLSPFRLRTSGKVLRVGAVSLSTGELRYWGEDSKDIVKAVIASSAFPGFFNPVRIDGQLWIDGGVREVVPVRPIVDLGATEVDIIATSPCGMVSLCADKLNVIGAAPRIIDTMSEEIMDNDIDFANKLSQEQNLKVRILRPSDILPVNSLDFDPGLIEDNAQRGYNDAIKVSWV